MLSRNAMKSASDIWETAKGSLQVQVNKANYQTWLKDTVGISYQGDQFVVGTSKAFAKEWLEKRLHSLIKKTLISIIGHDIEVQFQVCGPPSRGHDDHDTPRQPSNPLQSRLPLPKLNAHYTFGSFVVGDSNRLAYAAALGVAEDPGHQYNPLFIYSEPGLGKTHLVQAIGNEACENGLDVAYASGEQFTNEFVNALREKTTDQFRRKFRSVDLLIIEDIQFIIGKQQTQMSLFHTFDELHNANRQLVITSNRPPGAMSSLENGLCSRLECGLVAKVRRPDPKTRLSILRAKAEQQKVLIDNAIFEFVAERCKTNVRELEGYLNRVIAYTKLARKKLSLDLAKEALEALQDMNPQSAALPGLTAMSILDAVAVHFNVSVESMKSRKRNPRLVLARQIGIYLVREKTNHPLDDIGKMLGGRDHSSILRAYQRISEMVYSDPKVQGNLKQILRTLPA